MRGTDLDEEVALVSVETTKSRKSCNRLVRPIYVATQEVEAPGRMCVQIDLLTDNSWDMQFSRMLRVIACEGPPPVA